MKKLIAISLMISFLVALSSCRKESKVIDGNDKPTIPAIKPPEILDFDNKNLLDSAVILSSYKTNPTLADKQYKNNLYRILGVIVSTGKEEDGKPFVNIGVSNNPNLGFIHCLMFEQSLRGDIKTLKIGESIRIFGYATQSNEKGQKVTVITAKNCTVLASLK
jgi:hypothetical protein